MLYENYFLNKKAHLLQLTESEAFYGKPATDSDYDFHEFPNEFYEDDMVIWIDPLDGTKGFIEGHLHHITSLIGVSIN